MNPYRLPRGYGMTNPYSLCVQLPATRKRPSVSNASVRSTPGCCADVERETRCGAGCTPAPPRPAETSARLIAPFQASFSNELSLSLQTPKTRNQDELDAIANRCSLHLEPVFRGFWSQALSWIAFIDGHQLYWFRKEPKSPKRTVVSWDLKVANRSTQSAGDIVPRLPAIPSHTTNIRSPDVSPKSYSRSHLAPIFNERFLISRRKSLSLKKSVCLQTRAMTLQHDL